MDDPFFTLVPNKKHFELAAQFKGITSLQKYLSQVTGFSPSYVSMIFNEKREPSPEFLVSAAHHLGLSLKNEEWARLWIPVQKPKGQNYEKFYERKEVLSLSEKIF